MSETGMSATGMSVTGMSVTGRLSATLATPAPFGAEGGVLRPLHDDDHLGLIAGLNDLEVSRWTASIPYPFGLDDAQAYLDLWQVRKAEGRGIALAIETEGHLAGVISLRESDGAAYPSLGYWLARSCHGKGIGGAAVKGFLGLVVPAFGLTGIDAAITVGNMASARILKTNGFVPTGFDTCFCRATGTDMDSETFHWRA